MNWEVHVQETREARLMSQVQEARAASLMHQVQEARRTATRRVEGHVRQLVGWKVTLGNSPGNSSGSSAGSSAGS